MFKKIFIISTTVVALAACQTPVAQPEVTTAAIDIATETKDCPHCITSVQSKSLAIIELNKSSVHSWHFGLNAQKKTYLLVVLNEAVLTQIKNNHKSPTAFKLYNQIFDSNVRIQGGFLVIDPLPTDWNEQKIAQLLS